MPLSSLTPTIGVRNDRIHLHCTAIRLCGEVRSALWTSTLSTTGNVTLAPGAGVKGGHRGYGRREEDA